MKTRLLFLPLLLALVVSLAACGGSSSSVPANAIAVVAGQPILISDFNALFTQVEKQRAAQGNPKPTPGSSEYTALRNEVVSYLVQVAEVKQQAKKENISATPAEVTKFLQNVAKQQAGGSMTKLAADLAKQGLTMNQARAQVVVTLLEQKIHAKVTKAAKVTPAQEEQYYRQHLTQYAVPAATTRNIQYILFKCAAQGSTTCPASKNRAEKRLADMVEQKLQNGASFAAMAKQYSDDPSTASNGGKLCISKSGQAGACIPTVPAFANAGFALKTGAISQPVDATAAADQGYGWFIIKASAPPKTTKAHTTSFKDAEATIKTTLLTQAQDALWSTWLSDLVKEYQGKVSYAATYAPPTTTTIPSTTSGTPTG